MAICLTYNVRGGKALPLTPEELKRARAMATRESSERLKEITLALFNGEGTLSIDERNKLEEEKKRLKLARPALIPHAARFDDYERKSEKAHPSGLVMFDIDHYEGDLVEFFENKVKPNIDVWKISLVEKSASDDGMHIFFEKPLGMTIQQAQKWMAQNLGVAYDEGVFDLARACFVVPEEYVLYQNDDRLFKASPCPSDIPLPLERESNTLSDEHPHSNTLAPNEVEGEREERSEGKGASIFGLKVFDLCLEETGLSQSEIDIPGERNWHNTLKAILSVGICQFLEKEQLLAVVKRRMPNYYETEDCRRLVSDFYKNYCDPNGRMTITQRTIYARAVKESQKEEAALSESQFPMTENNLALPRLPRLLQLLVRAYPAEFRPAVVVSSLVFLGTLLSRLRAHYLDGSTHSTSFFACVVAPQASGKSFSRRLYEILTAPIKAQDSIYRKMEQDYKKQKDTAKNSRQQPVEPETHIRLLPATTSNAIILKRADKSDGLHLCTYAEEIDTLTKGQKAGAWSQKSDIYRMAFDNAEWGQDYMSDNSYSACVKIFYNLLVCGTPNAMNRYFSDVEDGLVSRVTFVELPDMMGAPMPKFANFNRKEAQEIKDIVQELYELGSGGASPQPSPKGEGANNGEDKKSPPSGRCEGNQLIVDSKQQGEVLCETSSETKLNQQRTTVAQQSWGDSEEALIWVNCPKLNQAIDGWLEDRRQEYLQNQDNPALEIFRRRSAVIGFRAGIVAYALSGMRYSTMVSEFALWVANFTLQNQLALFGERMNQVMQKVEDKTTEKNNNKGRNHKLLEELPERFTSMDVVNLRLSYGLTGEVYYIISRWVKNGLIEKVDSSHWEKI